jgi:hypothetical protein
MANSPNFDEIFGAYYDDEEETPADPYTPGTPSINNEQPEAVDNSMPDFDRLFAESENPTEVEETPELDEEDEPTLLDHGKNFVKGFAEAGGMIAGAGEYVQRQVGSDLLAELYGIGRKAAQASSEEWVQSMTPAAQRDLKKKYASTGEDAAWKDLDSVMFTIIGSAPSTIAGMGPSVVAARAAFGAAIKQGATKAIAAKEAAKAAGTAGAMAEGGMGAGGVAADITSQLEQMSSEELQGMEAYQDLQKKYPDLEESDLRSLLIASATRYTAMAAGLVTAAVGKLGGKMEAKAFTGGGSRIKAGAAGGAAETVQEVPQSVSETMATNVGLEKPLMEGTLESGLAGAVGGAGTGTGMGVIAGPGDAAPESSDLLSELDQNEKDTEQMGQDIDQLKAMNGAELEEYQQQVREDVASRGGDQLEQELAAATAGRDAGQVLDSEVENLTRLWNQRQAADEEARYFEDQQKDDAAREKIQSEAAEKYEAGQKQIAADKQAADDKARLAEKVESDLARTKRVQDAQATRTEEKKAETVKKQSASDKADAQLRKLRKRRQELGLEPKGDLEGQSPYPSAPTVEAFKGKKPKSNAMAEALAKATQTAADKSAAEAELGTAGAASKTEEVIQGKPRKGGRSSRILFRKGEEGASKRLVDEIKTKEGFTVNNDTGQPVTKGFSVGQGMEEVIEGEVSEAQLDAFRAQHAEALADPANVLGAWYNKKDGKTYLDVSTVFNTREEAMAAGITNKELAIYDLESGQEISLESKGNKYFDKKALQEPHSQISPQEFLDMAETLKFPDQQKQGDLRTLIDKDSTPLNSLPVLTVKDGKVVGHEGRHRAMELMSRGVKSMPVRIIGGSSETLTSQDGKRQMSTPKGQEGRDFAKFFAKITKGLAGKSTTGKEYAPVIGAVAQNLSNPVSDQGRFAAVYSKFRGNFDDHIAFSIPGFKEVQVAVGAAIAKVYGKGANILDIGASEGSFVKAITSTRQAHTIALDPSEAMEATFNATPVEGSEYSRTAFGTREQEGALAWPEDDDGPETTYFDPQGEKFDVVHEAMVFQFVSSDRITQINRVKQLLKAGGVAIFEQKVFTNAKEANETKKNEYKRQYFEEKDMDQKATEILEGMEENMVHQENLEQELKNNFAHVVQFWDSGEFKGYVASDSKAAADTLSSAIGDTSSEFSTTATPRKVESPQKVREKIQLRRVDNKPRKVDNQAAGFVVRDLNDRLPGLKVNLLESPYNLPDTLFDKVSNEFGAMGMEARGMIDSKTGEIYVFSDNHSSIEDLVTTVMHEGVGHKGLRVLFNEEQKNELLDSVFANGERAAMNRIAKSYGLDGNVVKDQRLIADEYIAEMAEKNIDAPIMQRVIDSIRQVLKSLGLLQTWTDSDIKALLRRTRSALKDGKPLSKIKLRTEVEVEETGEVVAVEQTASVALRQLDKRIEVCKKLKECVG